MRLVFALAFAVLGVAAPAWAEPKAPTLEERRFAEKEMAYFGQCVVRTNRQRALQFVALSPGSKEAKDVARFIAVPRCLSLQARKMKMKPDMLRWSLFEALYAADFGKAAAPQPADWPMLDFRAERQFLPADQAVYAGQFVATRQFGDCAVKKEPAKTHALLATEVYTTNEQAIVNELKPVLGQCLPGDGSVGFSRTSLRGIMAEALFKLRTAGAASKGVAL